MKAVMQNYPLSLPHGKFRGTSLPTSATETPDGNCCRWTGDRADPSDRLSPTRGSARGPPTRGTLSAFPRCPRRQAALPERRRSGAARPRHGRERGSGAAPRPDPLPLGRPAPPPRAGAGLPPPPGAGCRDTHRSAVPCRAVLCCAPLCPHGAWDATATAPARAEIGRTHV